MVARGGTGDQEEEAGAVGGITGAAEVTALKASGAKGVVRGGADTRATGVVTGATGVTMLIATAPDFTTAPTSATPNQGTEVSPPARGLSTWEPSGDAGSWEGGEVAAGERTKILQGSLTASRWRRRPVLKVKFKS